MDSYTVELEELAPRPVAVVRGHVDVAGIAGFLGGAFGEVMQVLSEQGLRPAGPPFGRYRPSDGGFDVEAGFPASGAVVSDGRVERDELPGGPAATVLHRGDYAAIAPAYEAATAWLAGHGYEPAGEAWEDYLDGPEVPEPRTVVHVPCRPV